MAIALASEGVARHRRRMLFLPLKALISGILIAVASTLAKRYPGFGALIASLPLVSVLGMLWLWGEKPDSANMASHVQATFWFVLPSLPMFLVIPALLRARPGVLAGAGARLRADDRPLFRDAGARPAARHRACNSRKLYGSEQSRSATIVTAARNVMVSPINGPKGQDYEDHASARRRAYGCRPRRVGDRRRRRRTIATTAVAATATGIVATAATATGAITGVGAAPAGTTIVAATRMAPSPPRDGLLLNRSPGSGGYARSPGSFDALERKSSGRHKIFTP